MKARLHQVSSVKRGYFLPQDYAVAGPEGQFIVEMDHNGWYLNTREAAKVQIDEWKKRKLDGIEFIPMVFQKADVDPVMDLAKMMQDAGVDVWVTPRLFKTFNVFPQVPMKLAGKQLSKDGFIQTPLKNWSMRPEPDWFNPEAVEWVFGIFKEDFLDHMEGGFQGFRWPEECHSHSLYGRVVEKGLIPYWQRPSYSDYSLEKWREYCRKHEVTHEDKLVDKFPVHEPGMVANGKGRTAYYPGLQALPQIVTDEPVVNRPRNTGVWAHWEQFRCEMYLNIYLRPFARLLHEANRHNPTWHGVEYFGSSPWLLSYEKVTDPELNTGAFWGYQGAIDVEALGRAPEITYITHEFRGKVKDAQLEKRHDLFLMLIDDRARQNHGVLLHGDSSEKWCYTHADWSKVDPRPQMNNALDPQEEIARWGFVKKYQPRLLSMWSISMLHPAPRINILSSFEEERMKRVSLFWQRLRAYQETSDPFAEE